MKKTKCPRCLGTGQVQDQRVLGLVMKSLRGQRTLREMAECMGVSFPHLSLLEHGKRRWTPELVKKYKECCR